MAPSRDAHAEMNGSVVADGLQFTEGPVWVNEEHARRHGFSQHAGLLFSDIETSTQYLLTEGDLRVVRRDSQGANGNTLTSDGTLLCCEHLSRRVGRVDPKQGVVTLVDRFDGARLNSPNDLCVVAGDALVFTDPPYGVAPDDRELPFSGVYRLNANGTLELLDDRLVKPNGVALDPDRSSLWVADTETGHVWRYEFSEAGLLLRRERMVTFSRPDGLAFDATGHLLAATAEGISVLDTLTAEVDHIACPQRPANLCFGGRDGDDLLVCARSDVYQFKWHSPGLHLIGAQPAPRSRS
jgi:gluconolactonase